METNRIWGFFPAQKYLFTERSTQSNTLIFSNTRKTLTKQVPQKAAKMVRGLEQTSCQQLGWFRQRKRADTNQNGLGSVLKGEFSASLLQLSSPSLPPLLWHCCGVREADRGCTEESCLLQPSLGSVKALIEQRLPVPFNPWHVLSQSSKK